MKLAEYQGKQLFRKYGIAVPQNVLLSKPTKKLGVNLPCVIKAQVHSGNRNSSGGIIMARTIKAAQKGIQKLLGNHINGERVKEVLVEEKIAAASEYYISFSYDTDSQGPVFSCSINGGSGIRKAKIFPIDIVLGVQSFFIRDALKEARFTQKDFNALTPVILNLWSLFIHEYALLAEINPLFKTKEGTFIAGDAKLVIDDEKARPAQRRLLEMAGDIAILASGGGASLLNIDALIASGGKPANYTEYSGNPKGEVVKELTKRVLSRPGLKGCWVVGGTANFTDIYETMRGFIAGLEEVTPKPTYPIVIRRDGPRQKEAFAMLEEVGKKEGYQFYLFGSETPMAQTAKIMTKLAYNL